MARRGLTSERLDRARAARPADTWATYAQSLRQNPDDRALRDAILQFSIEHAETADVSKLPGSFITDGLRTNLWRELQRAEQLWSQKKGTEAVDAFVRALENLNDAEAEPTRGASVGAWISKLIKREQRRRLGWSVGAWIGNADRERENLGRSTCCWARSQDGGDGGADHKQIAVLLAPQKVRKCFRVTI